MPKSQAPGLELQAVFEHATSPDKVSGADQATPPKAPYATASETSTVHYTLTGAVI